ARRLARAAHARRIEVLPETRIARVDAQGAETVGGERIAADLVVWATGAAPIAFPRRTATGGSDAADAPAIGRGSLARDPDGFLEIRSTLQLIGCENVFAVGDCARLVEHPWVPRAGVYAVRQGPVLERNL